MPKKTFFNLSDKKRERIISASKDEFSECSYESASINKIVKSADIAKGSFYQYFENKEDIYRFTLELCEEKKDEYMGRTLNRTKYMGVFDRIREVYKSMIRFSEDNPKEASILDYMYRIDDSEFRTELLSSSKSENSGIFEEVVARGEEDNEIRNSLDKDILIKLLYNLDIFIKDDLEGKSKLFDYESKVDSLIDIIESGIKTKSRNSRALGGDYY